MRKTGCAIVTVMVRDAQGGRSGCSNTSQQYSCRSYIASVDSLLVWLIYVVHRAVETKTRNASNRH